MRILEFREYKGPNIYSYYPVVKAVVDLEDLAGVWTDEIEGLADSLSKVIPQLQQHYCSRGRPGGFLERLREGTLFGHVVEHVALELENMLGYQVIHGKTIELSNSVYEIVVEVVVMETGKEAIRLAVQIVSTLVKGEEVRIDPMIQELKEVDSRYGYGPSTMAIIKECQARDIPVSEFAHGGILQLGYGVKQKRLQATITQNTSCIAVDIAGDKDLTKKLLAEAGIPVPLGYVVKSEESALQVSDLLGRPVVAKPSHGNHGKGVSLNLSSDAEIRTAFRLAAAHGEDVIIEKYIAGKQYRLLVIGDRLVAASERFPAYVIGNGVDTIKTLVKLANENPLRGEGHEKPLTTIKIDPVACLTLAKQGLTVSSIPEKGRQVYLRENANLSSGGTAQDVTALVHQQIRNLAVRATKIIGLDVAGLDLITADISKPLCKETAVIEINAAPGFRMHLHPSEGERRNVAADLVDYLLPDPNQCRIPIISVTGTNGKTTTTRLIGHIASLMGKCIGVASTGGIFIDNECIMKGDTTGPQSAQNILRDQRVELAVLETARGGILRSGLGYDKADVGVITNVREDHLGIGGIRDLAELARVKSLVVEALRTDGTAVLNVDDPWCVEIAQTVRENLVFYSLSEDNLIIRRHLATGQKAVFIKDNYLVYAEGEYYRKILPLTELPIGMKGLATFNIANALAAVAACHSINIPLGVIREGLRTFGLKREHNPGRCQIYNLSGVKVMLDYGHNADAFYNVLSLARKMTQQNLIGVMGVPGDRRNEDIINAGNTAARFLDYCIIKEDCDLRGRKPGEGAALLMEGIRSHGEDIKQVEVILSEIPAALAGLSKCKPGDMLVIFYENLKPLQKLLEQMEFTGEVSYDVITDERVNDVQLVLP